MNISRSILSFIIPVALTVILGVPLSGQAVFENSTNLSNLCPITEAEEPLDIDPYPTTELDSVVLMTPQERAQVELIGRIAEGVRKVGRDNGGGQWWECGRIYTEEEEKAAATIWAYRIVQLASEYSDRGSADGIQINPWEIAGIAANETGFDRCILGKWPRKWGYQHKTIKRSKLGISHTYADVERTLTHPMGERRWATVGFDASPLHMLWQCSNGLCRPKFNKEQLPPIPMKEVFSLGAGFEYSVRDMKKRAIDNHTSHPSLYWRGSRCEWYYEKIRNWARVMGAHPEELR